MKKEAKHTYTAGQVFNPFKMIFFVKTISGHKCLSPKEVVPVGLTSCQIQNLIKIRVQLIWEEDPSWLLVRVWDYYGFDHDMWVEATHLQFVIEGPSRMDTWPSYFSPYSGYVGYGSSWANNPFEIGPLPLPSEDPDESE